MGASIFDASVGELSKSVSGVRVVFGLLGPRTEPYIQRAELGVGVLVVDALLERAHRLLWLYGLGSDNIGYLEVERDVFTAGGRRSARGSVASPEGG